ncbi:hypothetical protein HRbin36_02741 [bacterium HR36]|nr:hypothetical protein HRbin36_02741 [bacterium HR36]
MQLVRPIGFARSAGPGYQRSVHGKGMARGSAGEQFQEHRQMFPPWDDFLNAHEGDMHPRPGGGHPAIPFVGNQHQGTSLSNSEIHACDANVRFVKALPQQLPTRLRDGLRILGNRLAQMPRQNRGNVLPRVMDGWGHYVRGTLPAKLDDKFTEIRFRHLHSRRLQRLVEADFLAGHGLGFDYRPAAMVPDDFQHDVACPLSILGPMHLPTRSLHCCGQLFEIAIQMSQRVGFDGFGVTAQRFAVGQCGETPAVPLL